MSNISREALVKVAQQAARKIGGQSYIPDSESNFTPHEWVIEAMRSAIDYAERDVNGNHAPSASRTILSERISELQKALNEAQDDYKRRPQAHAPTIYRMWVNQPSSAQPFHSLNGKLVLGYEESATMCRVYPLEGDVESRQMPSMALSRGWPKHLLPKPAKKEFWRVMVVYKSTSYEDESFRFDTEAEAKQYIRDIWFVSDEMDYKEILSTTLTSEFE